jgi:signal transduction histidine kinase
LLILVEDDGVGLRESTETARPGEQIGLNSMKERASRIKAEFSLESEPGEGTCLMLDVDLARAKSRQPSVKIDNRFNLT